MAAVAELESKLNELRGQLEANEQEWKNAISEQDEAWAEHSSLGTLLASKNTYG